MTQKKKQERDLHRLGLHSQSGDISFVLFLTGPALIPARGRAREMVDNGRSSIPDGSWKDCQCHAHNEDGQIILLSSEGNDFLRAFEMDALYLGLLPLISCTQGFIGLMSHMSRDLLLFKLLN